MANQTLGVGEGLFPPAQFAAEQNADHCIRQAKTLIDSAEKDLKSACRWLASAREQCNHGEWGNLLRKHGVARTTAWRIVTQGKEIEQVLDIEANVPIGTNGDVETGPNKELRKPPAAPAPPEPKQRNPGHGDQEEAEEPHLKQTRIAMEMWQKRIDDLAKTRENAAALAKRALDKIRAGLEEYNALASLPVKSGPPVRGRCKECNAPILWTYNQNGKRQPHDDGGQLHFLTCPARKKK